MAGRPRKGKWRGQGGAVRHSRSMWYPLLRPALFALDPERAHALALEALALSGRRYRPAPSATPVECMGLRFPNRVGLAAGFDKNASAVDGLGRLGFGFLEVGTVTPRPQPGQPRPRLFRLPAAAALVNRLGFPNEGVAAVAARLRHRRFHGIVGVNIGKNAATPLDRALDDYVACLQGVARVADYVAVNVSSPNTPLLRELQSRARLEPLLTALLAERRAHATGRPLPLLLKISPDLVPDELAEIAALVRQLGLDGVIATNTTLGRDGLGVRAPSGGISGRPLHARAVEVVRALRAHLGPGIAIVGVGGVESAATALEFRAAGADLVALYTGLIYRGPALVRDVMRALGRDEAPA